MAEKYSVHINYKFLEIIEGAGLSDANAGLLFRGVIEYGKTGKIPNFNDSILTGIFITLKYDIDHPKEAGWTIKWFTYSENNEERKSAEYKQWRKNVLKRDRYTCQLCHSKTNKLHAHHIKSFAKHPELRFKISNGLTICEQCHIDLHRGLDNG